MARNRRLVKRTGVSHYHVMSRTNGRRYILDRRVKDGMVRILKRVSEFTGVAVEGFCLMDDHFHIVCKVVKPEAAVSEDEVLRRIAALKGVDAAADLGRRWAELRDAGMGEMVDASLERWRSRMNDLSEFVKCFKELVNVMYKSGREHCGGLWSGRFKSTLIEDGRYLATCIRYVELNPVRAGMVASAAEYAWSSAKEPKERGMAFLFGEAGSVPGEWRLRRRIVQIGGGMVLGSRGFVTAVITESMACFSAAVITARPVGDWAFTSHGYMNTGGQVRR